VSRQHGSGVLETHLPENGRNICNTYLVNDIQFKNIIDVTLTKLTGTVNNSVGKEACLK
jgi:hypothetical protein